MPDTFELPWMRSAVIKLMRRERFTGFVRRVVNKFIALPFRHSVGRSRRRAAGRSGLEPGLAAVIRALNNLTKPAARLRGVNAVRVHVRTLHMIDLPSGKMRTTNVPFFPFSI